VRRLLLECGGCVSSPSMSRCPRHSADSWGGRASGPLCLPPKRRPSPLERFPGTFYQLGNPLGFGDVDRIWKSHTIFWKLKGWLFSALVLALCYTTLKYGPSRNMAPHEIVMYESRERFSFLSRIHLRPPAANKFPICTGKQS
jgi:hypothetical protein